MSLSDWFKNKLVENPTVETFTKEFVTVSTEKDDVIALQQAALLQIPEIAKQQPERLEKFKKAHADDVSSYRFSCKRHGDFLAVFITRGPDRHAESDYNYRTNKTVAAINIASTSYLSLQSGSDPAADNIGSFYPVWGSDKKYSPVCSQSTDWHPRRVMLADKNIGLSYGGGVHYFVNLPRELASCLDNIRVPGIARSAVDDKIVFEGAGISLCIPHGLGDVVYSKILASCAGYLSAKKVA